tara:strand:+ start:217 stop:666 length:450 start_codon:yes stop_codon:yes gene_type:complete
MARIKAEAVHQATLLRNKLQEKKASAPNESLGTEKKKRKLRKKGLARKMRKEMRRLQSSSKNMISKATMQRIIRQIADDISPEGTSLRWTGEAIEQLQTAAEDYVHSLFTGAYALTTRVGGRQTIRPEELRFIAAQQDEAKERYSATKD